MVRSFSLQRLLCCWGIWSQFASFPRAWLLCTTLENEAEMMLWNCRAGKKKKKQLFDRRFWHSTPTTQHSPPQAQNLVQEHQTILSLLIILLLKQIIANLEKMYSTQVLTPEILIDRIEDISRSTSFSRKNGCSCRVPCDNISYQLSILSHMTGEICDEGAPVESGREDNQTRPLDHVIHRIIQLVGRAQKGQRRVNPSTVIRNARHI